MDKALKSEGELTGDKVATRYGELMSVEVLWIGPEKSLAEQ